MILKTEIRTSSKIDSAKWNDVVKNSAHGCVFMEYEYISAIAPEWEGITVHDDDGKYEAVFPLFTEKKYGFSLALQPVPAKYWGVCIRDASAKNDYEKISRYKKITEAICAAIPTHISWIEINFNPLFPYPHPFYRDEYKMQSNYTYRLELNKDFETLFSAFQDRVRTEIRKAEKSGLQLRLDENTENLEAILLHNKVQGKEFVNKKLLGNIRNIFKAYHTQQKAKIFTVLTGCNEVAASSLVVSDDKTAYYILGNKNEEFNAQEPSLFMTSKIIKHYSGQVNTLDFTGLMNEKFEAFFRKFAPVPVQYNRIIKKKFPFSLLR